MRLRLRARKFPVRLSERMFVLVKGTSKGFDVKSEKRSRDQRCAVERGIFPNYVCSPVRGLHVGVARSHKQPKMASRPVVR